jgi:hypothetical protein
MDMTSDTDDGGGLARRGTFQGSFGEDALDALRVIAAGAIAGFLWGAVVGGLGGRMAMFVLRLTSDPQVRFFDTDDGFGIGSVTLDTIFLVIFTAAVGVIGGLAYLGMRRWLPAQQRALSTAVVAAAVGGSLFIEPGGVDFTRLAPLWLAIALFVALPGLYGFALSRTAERLMDNDSVLHRVGWWGVAPVAVLVLAGPLAVALVLAGAAWGAARRYPKILQWWRSGSVTYVGRFVLAAMTIFAAVQLLRDATEILV